MTGLIERRKAGTAALSAVTAATGLVVALALYSFVASMVRFIGAATMTAEGIELGVSVPAAAFDGVSTGELSIGQMLIATMYDGNGVPSRDAHAFTQSLKDVVVPYFAAESLNAALVLALSIIVLLLCLRLVRGKPFVKHMTVGLAVFAALVAVFSIASQLLRRLPFVDAYEPVMTPRKDFAWLLTDLQLPPDPSVIRDDSVVFVPDGAPLPLDLTLVGIAVLIGLVAAAFAIGRRMQRDTEGLV